ncbi:MAG: hypothetical protein E7664_05770 [Ruminococcaceae bacterium]|nr:hypothetical protein [Oscillospiraceae bacterium]
MYYAKDFVVRWHDTDLSGRVRPSAVMVYMQETANCHLEEHGPSLTTLREVEKKIFILSKLRLELYEPLHAYDRITVQTWTSENRGYAFLRSFRILRNGTVAARAFTQWALLRADTHALMRNEEFQYGMSHGDAPELSIPRRLSFPENMTVCGERTIRYADADYNHHMNNTRYPDMLCDYMPLEDAVRVRAMTLSFVSEAPLGETLTVLRGQEGQAYAFRTVNQAGKTCLEAQVELFA